MKNRFKFFIIIILIVLISINTIIYFDIKESYPLDSKEYIRIRMFTIFFINLTFVLIMFLIDVELYRNMMIIMIIIGVYFWIYVIFKQYLVWMPFDWNLFEVVIILTFAIIPPGLILYTLHYIKKDSTKYGRKTFGGKYHIHESFMGVLLLIIAIALIILRFNLIQHEIFWRELNFILAINNLSLFFILFFASFAMFRDWDDLIHFKFIEKKLDKKKETNSNYKTTVFSELGVEDLHFFEFPKLIMFPIGILLANISLSIVIYGIAFLPKEIFNLEPEIVPYLGYLGIFIAGGLLGKDWLRLFKRFYPELYQEIEDVISKLKNR